MQEINLCGLKELSSFRVLDEEIAKENEKVERGKAKAEATDAEGRAAV